MDGRWASACDVDGSWSSLADDFDRLSELSTDLLDDTSERAPPRSARAQFNSCPARLGGRNSLKRQAASASVYEQLLTADASAFEEKGGLPLGSWPRVRRRHSPSPAAMSVFELNDAFAEQLQPAGTPAGTSHEHSPDATIRLGNDLSRIHLPEELGPAPAAHEWRAPPTTIPEDDEERMAMASEPATPLRPFGDETEMERRWSDETEVPPEAQLDALMDPDSFLSLCESDDPQTADAIVELLSMMGEGAGQQPTHQQHAPHHDPRPQQQPPQQPPPQPPPPQPPPPQPPPPQPPPPQHQASPLAYARAYAEAPAANARYGRDMGEMYAEAPAANAALVGVAELQRYASAVPMPMPHGMAAVFGAEVTSAPLHAPPYATAATTPAAALLDEPPHLQPLSLTNPNQRGRVGEESGTALTGYEISGYEAAAPLPAAVLAAPMRMRNMLERKEWSAEEDQHILDGVLAYGCKWRKIAAQLPGRSDDAVRNRWNRLKDAASDAGSEDSAGKRKAALAAAAATRATVSSAGEPCEEPKRVERLGWTHQEDAMIMRLVNEHGHRWSQIARRLAGRTEHAIRNRWHRLQKMQQDGALQPSTILPMDVHQAALAAAHSMPAAMPAALPA